MKRLIFLKVADGNPENKKMKAADAVKLEEKMLELAKKEFFSKLKSNSNIKTIKDLVGLPQIVIEFPDDSSYESLTLLRGMDIIDLIDATLPLSESKPKIKEEDSHDEHLAKLRAKMEKYKK